MIRTVLKWFGIVLAGIVAAAVLAVAALYIPGVPVFVASKVLPGMERSTGMRISVGDISLKFPLEVRLSDALIMTSPTDTMVSARALDVDVRFLPLLHGDISVGKARLTDGFYQMGGRDSMYLRAEADELGVNGATINFGFTDIDVNRAELSGGRVALMFGDSIVGKDDRDTTSSQPMTIRAREIVIRNVDYEMKMLPVIDSLAAHVAEARLSSGLVDMSRSLISVHELAADSVTAAYFTPSADYLAAHPADSVAEEPLSAAVGSVPWTVRADRISLTSPSAVYAVAGAVPKPGLDMDYLQVRDVAIEVDSFENRGVEIRVPLRRLVARERCGLRLDASGVFAMDSSAMRAEGFKLVTLHSEAVVDATMGLVPDMSRSPLVVVAKAQVGLPDIESAFPSMAGMLGAMPRQVPLMLSADVHGTLADFHVGELSASMQRVFDVSASGQVRDVSDFGKMVADLDIDGNVYDPGVAKPTLRELKLTDVVAIPPLSLEGNVKADRGAYSGDVTATTGSGRIALRGRYAGIAPDYAAAVEADSFPVGAFLPNSGVGAVSASVRASGHGFNPYDSITEINLDADIGQVTYLGRRYGGVTLAASVNGGAAHADIVSTDRAAQLSATVDALLSARRTDWDLDARIGHLDLMALGLADTVMQGSVNLRSNGCYSQSPDSLGARLRVDGLNWMIGSSTLTADDLSATIDAGVDSVRAGITGRQIEASFVAAASLDSLLSGFDRAMAEAGKQYLRRDFSVDSIGSCLPTFALRLKSGPDNIINDYLRGSDMGYNTLELHADNDSALQLAARVTRLRSGNSTLVDTLGVILRQRGPYLLMTAKTDNAPGTMDEFAHVLLRAGLNGNKLSAHIKQENIKGENGYSVGFTLTAEPDSTLMLNFIPYNPIIAYKHWTVNPDNFIRFNPQTRRFGANLDMAGGDSRLSLMAEEPADASEPQKARLSVSDVKLADWLSVSPFAPPVDGMLSAELDVSLVAGSLTGSGAVNLDDLTYGRERVGSFDVALDLYTDRSGVVNTEMSLMVDSVKTITAVGSLNDSTKADPFDLDFSMIKMPLRVANPFLPKNMAQLSGTLNGSMQITGTIASPVFNGYVQFDSAAVNVGMLGSSFRFSDDRIPVDSNVVRFSDYAISGVNSNPLTISGTVDMAPISAPSLDLSLQARNMQVVGGKKRKGSDVYGSAFIDLDATARGNMSRFIAVNAGLTLLRATDVTYILGDAATAALGSEDTGEMVRFVNFADTAVVADADTVEQRNLAMMIDALLTVQPGATVSVDLSNDASNKVQIQPEGTLDYSFSPFGQSRVTGRLTINDGFVRYSPPLISVKNFTFTPGSYVAFNGDMLNPTLNIKAVDVVRANVTRPGENSRLINFDISVTVTGTLERMNVAFDLASEGDITVQNELQSMSPDQRANQAMNLMLYNVYTGSGTTADSNLSGNALYSFLTSQVNSWAANNIRGVDLSFGIDQYDRTYQGATSTTTSYNYKVSKSLFDNRFKIVVGGNYSTDADADENFAENLISDISFEYMLTKSGSVYVRLFRHTGYESILEGEITQTGVGFVYKHKLQRLSDMFNFLRPRRKTVITNE